MINKTNIVKVYVSCLCILLIVITGCMSPTIGMCSSKQDLSNNELELFENTTLKYIELINSNNSLELSKHISADAENIPDMSAGNIILLFGNQIGAVKDPTFIDILNINSNGKGNSICTQSIDDKKGTFFVTPL